MSALALGLAAQVLLGQVEITTPGQAPGITPHGIFDPADAGAPAIDAGAVPLDGGLPGLDAGAPDCLQRLGVSAADDGGLESLRARAAAASEAAAQAALAALQARLYADQLRAALTPAAAADGGAPPSPPPPTNLNGWNGTAGLSLIAFTGNAEAVTLSTTATIIKTFRGGWIATLHLAGNYGEARLTTTSPETVTALQASGQLRGDRVFARSATVYALGGLDTDHVDSLELREYAEPGVALFWLDRRDGDLEKLLLRSDFGFRYAHESRFQYYPNELNLGQVQFLGPRFGLAFHIAASKEVSFSQEGELLRDLTSNRTIVNTSTKIAAHLVKQFSLTLSFLVAYDSSPPLNRLTTDTALTAGVEMSF